MQYNVPPFHIILLQSAYRSNIIVVSAECLSDRCQTVPLGPRLKATKDKKVNFWKGHLCCFYLKLQMHWKCICNCVFLKISMFSFPWNWICWSRKTSQEKNNIRMNYGNPDPFISAGQCLMYSIKNHTRLVCVWCLKANHSMAAL